MSHDEQGKSLQAVVKNTFIHTIDLEEEAEKTSLRRSASDSDIGLSSSNEQEGSKFWLGSKSSQSTSSSAQSKQMHSALSVSQSSSSGVPASAASAGGDELIQRLHNELQVPIAELMDMDAQGLLRQIPRNCEGEIPPWAASSMLRASAPPASSGSGSAAPRASTAATATSDTTAKEQAHKALEEDAAADARHQNTEVLQHRGLRHRRALAGQPERHQQQQHQSDPRPRLTHVTTTGASATDQHGGEAAALPPRWCPRAGGAPPASGFEVTLISSIRVADRAGQAERTRRSSQGDAANIRRLYQDEPVTSLSRPGRRAPQSCPAASPRLQADAAFPLSARSC
eukprot:CAMPEP_0197932174 /NCGR_PEP_ID=MMETSP1439-20131203/108195_1 /TAXON_ID=66791 /ORGANISM="Gonyaulax spinifera, Strain CCMP409" /LENGTH=341 /DNA_ID=CAMNT_0043554947 /DNA_START=121 /DNA_END=1145 /DNA_ORIENTATION=+